MFDLKIGNQIMTGEKMFEVWEGGRFVAGIYPTEEGIKIISKYLRNRPEKVKFEEDHLMHTAIVSINLKIS